MTPPDFALLNSGLFLLAGMITGAWKHQKILHSPQRRAPVYVDIAHRASLMYSFATLVIWKLAETAPFPVAITWYAVVAPVAFSGGSFRSVFGMYLLIFFEISGVMLLAGLLVKPG